MQVADMIEKVNGIKKEQLMIRKMLAQICMDSHTWKEILEEHKYDIYKVMDKYDEIEYESFELLLDKYYKLEAAKDKYLEMEVEGFDELCY